MYVCINCQSFPFEIFDVSSVSDLFQEW